MNNQSGKPDNQIGAAWIQISKKSNNEYIALKFDAEKLASIDLTNSWVSMHVNHKKSKATQPDYHITANPKEQTIPRGPQSMPGPRPGNRIQAQPPLPQQVRPSQVSGNAPPRPNRGPVPNHAPGAVGGNYGSRPQPAQPTGYVDHTKGQWEQGAPSNESYSEPPPGQWDPEDPGY